MYFTNASVIIDGYAFLAENATINSENSIAPIYALGHSKIVPFSPSGPVRSSISINYIIDLNVDNALIVVNNLKSNISNTSSVSINGLTTISYLESFSFKITTNELIKANANYLCFENVSNTFTSDIITSLDTNSTLSDQTGLAHGWTSYLTDADNVKTIDIKELSYNFKVNYEAIYPIGNKLPTQVLFLNAQETINFITQDFRAITFDSSKVQDYFAATKYIKLSNYQSLYSSSNNHSYNIDISNAKIKSNQMDSQLDNYTLINTTAIKNY